VRTKFKNPPINELIVGVYFTSDTPGLRAEHVGVFWSSIRREFPKIQQQLPISHPIALPVGIAFELSSTSEPFPMPRFWLESTEPPYLMQIQKDAFLFNWRRKEADYPHFDEVKKGFDTNFARYANFLKSEFDISLPTIGVAELTYTNLIEPCNYWGSARDTKDVLPYFSFAPGDIAATESVEFNQVSVQRYASDLLIRTTVGTGKNEKGPYLVFELRCTGGQGNVLKEATEPWFTRAHDLIGECFLKMTSPDIQTRFWQPVN
jgi:uncharacterized protein (TIGR04255 family)